MTAPRSSCTCGQRRSPSQNKGILSPVWDGCKAAFNATSKGPPALGAMGFAASGVRKGSIAAYLQSRLCGGTTRGLFSTLQSAGAKTAAVSTALWVAVNLPYVVWEVYKALYRDGENPELWEALEECAGCAAGECHCGDDDCKCMCKRRARGAWARVKEFLCSSTFVDCGFIVLSVAEAVFTGSWFKLWPLINLVPSVYSSVRRNFLFK
ncbi:hypothetical protein C8Q80DRAFT_3887 [Daedaleopsis nitida]|nr:hypothetical protein C8Q80DRAFT_3887 [Daedaleopsis nitida]